MLRCTNCNDVFELDDDEDHAHGKSGKLYCCVDCAEDQKRMRGTTRVTLPIGLVMRIAELLGDIAKMKPGFEIYEKAKQLTKDLTTEMESQRKSTL